MNFLKWIATLLIMIGLSFTANAQKGHMHGHAHPKRKVVVHKHRHVRFVKNRPNGGVFMTHQGVKFYMHNKVCYRQVGRRWEVIDPNWAVGIKVLPNGYKVIQRGGCTFYHHGGKYYRKVNGGFITVVL